MNLAAKMICATLCGATLLVPLGSTQVLKGKQPQGQTQTPASSDPRLRAPAMNIKLGPPKMGPRINNPRAATHDAAIIAVLQEQKQAADLEFAQMKAIRTSSNLPAVQSQPASGPGVAARVAINKPGTLNKAGAGPTVGPGKVSDAPGNSSSSLARLPNIDATVVTCGHDPTMRILKVSGDSHPATFTPDAKYDLYTIHGCSFGDSHSNNKAWIYGPGFHQDFQIQEWSENGIAMMLAPNLSGVLDQDNLYLVVHRADGKEVHADGFKFYAARESVPLSSISQSQFTAGGGSLGAPTSYSSPSPDSTIFDPLTEIDREGTHPVTPISDTFDVGRLAAGFTPDNALLVYWYFQKGDCPALLGNPQRTLGPIEMDSRGAWNLGWDGNKLRVDTAAQNCQQVVKGFSNKPELLAYGLSRYAVEVWVRGPRCVHPLSGQPDQACIQQHK